MRPVGARVVAVACGAARAASRRRAACCAGGRTTGASAAIPKIRAAAGGQGALARCVAATMPWRRVHGLRDVTVRDLRVGRARGVRRARVQGDDRGAVEVRRVDALVGVPVMV